MSRKDLIKWLRKNNFRFDDYGRILFDDKNIETEINKFSRLDDLPLSIKQNYWECFLKDCIYKDLKNIGYLATNKVFKLVLLPTEQCNLRCKYCYEDYKLGKMKRNTVEAVKKLIVNRVSEPNFEYLCISWFGGEPLVEKDIVLEISEYAQQLSGNGKRFFYSSSMTTNGCYLDNNLFGKLLKAGVTKYQISIDGPRLIHDRSRIKEDGSGTFDEIWSNLIGMKEVSADFLIVLRLQLTYDNYESFVPFIAEIKKNFEKDERFRIVIKTIENFGDMDESQVRTLSVDQKNKCINRLYRLIGNNIDIVKFEREEDDFLTCYSAEPNALVIRSDGSLAKCIVALNEEVNKLGYIRDDGSLEINEEKSTFWTRGISSMDRCLLRCPRLVEI